MGRTGEADPISKVGFSGNKSPVNQELEIETSGEISVAWVVEIVK